MAQLIDPQRREFLRSALATATLAATASGLSAPECMASDPAFVPDLHIELRDKDEARIRSGQPTRVWMAGMMGFLGGNLLICCSGRRATWSSISKYVARSTRNVTAAARILSLTPQGALP
jgi:hypothetical protein